MYESKNVFTKNSKLFSEEICSVAKGCVLFAPCSMLSAVLFLSVNKIIFYTYSVQFQNV
jgi:hypothetical protein